MGHHSKGRPGRRAVPSSPDPEPAPPPAPAPAPAAPARPAPSTASGVGGRDLEDLADAARAARRTGWPFGVEVLASADTRGNPSAFPCLPTTPTAQPPAGPKPRRFATHQPTAPFEAIRTA
ncbi:hypothetical protein [Actinomycetospora sp. NBRC 106375]|uniref:hypothetical protein n=1 Tax=Actinomycetospora sp. NBRC 106375 TaxID=3032207 RepID=UPI002555E6E1|nr:hypothetical protein [Actinomycetospora sp. NBRC 106375]